MKRWRKYRRDIVLRSCIWLALAAACFVGTWHFRADAAFLLVFAALFLMAAVLTAVSAKFRVITSLFSGARGAAGFGLNAADLFEAQERRILRDCTKIAFGSLEEFRFESWIEAPPVFVTVRRVASPDVREIWALIPYGFTDQREQRRLGFVLAILDDSQEWRATPGAFPLEDTDRRLQQRLQAHGMTIADRKDSNPWLSVEGPH